MDRIEISKRMHAARQALQSPLPQAGMQLGMPFFHVTRGAQKQYNKITECKFRSVCRSNKISLDLVTADQIIKEVQKANTVLTLRKWARSIRCVVQYALYLRLKRADEAWRNSDWVRAERIVGHPTFSRDTTLARMMPAEYREGWKPTRRRKGKKCSLSRLPENWREQIAAISSGRYRIPTLVALITGCRPAELQKGIRLERMGRALYATIKGAKVTKTAGQETRILCLSHHHPITHLLKEAMETSELNRDSMMVQIKHANAVTTHLSKLSKKLWPKRKETISAYSARHAMAADCKAAIAAGADPDLASMVLGHVVDKTASYYGTKTQSKGVSVAPSRVVTTKPIKHVKRSINYSGMRVNKRGGQSCNI